MAGRKRIVEAPVFKTWEEVDAALKEVAEEEIAIADIEGEMNKQMNGIKITAAQEAKPHHDRISSVEKDIKQFVTEHRDELGGKKTKTIDSKRLFFSALLLNWTNVKVALFMMVGYTSFLLPGGGGPVWTFLLGMVMNLMCSAANFTWALGGSLLDRFFKAHEKPVSLMIASLLLYSAAKILFPSLF